MRALVLADRKSWEDSQAKSLAKDVDLIISLGDLSYNDLWCFKDINLPKIGVYGNHCYEDYLPEVNFLNLHKKVGDINTIKLIGFQGCLRYKENGYNQYTQEEVNHLMSNFPIADVFISHSPPRGIHDTNQPPHIGFDAMRTYCLVHKPKYFLHGHTYPETNETMLGETKVIYISGHRTIDLSF